MTSRWYAVLAAAHPGPTAAVAVLSAALAAGAGLSLARGSLVVAAVLTGQLVIGWSNDLVDAARDRQVGRQDKPLATGAISSRTVRGALGSAAVLCVAASLACGPSSAAAHLVVVASGLAYNLWLKGSVLSWLPFALAFGALPAVVTLALPDPSLPPWWTIAAGAMLGVGAHLFNVLPDLADDEATGVRGLPAVLGARRIRVMAPALLLAATAAAVLGSGSAGSAAGLVVLAGAVLLAGIAARGSGRVPFAAAAGIAVLCVVGLVVIAPLV